MKIVGIVLVVVLVFGSIFAVVKYNRMAAKDRKTLEKETYLRISAEESLDSERNNAAMLEKKLAKAQNKIDNLDKQLEQKKAVNKDLKARLTKVNQIKNNIEKKLVELESMVGATR